jgi:hypothetical protein
MSVCAHCGKEHPKPNPAEAAELVLSVVHDVTIGPRDGAAVLALALGRLCEIYTIPLEGMIRLVHGSHAISREISSAGPMPQRGTEWVS